ncbi:MAG: hypothetical protein KDA21_11685, partial [Phycisphaerales bacterium]|nr:hypothetical protein [Phycisphaerales bacterium]
MSRCVVTAIGAAAALSLFAPAARAGFENRNWVGGFIGWWNIPANWSGGVTPGADDNVMISTDTSGNIVVLYAAVPGAGATFKVKLSGDGNGATGIAQLSMGSGNGDLVSQRVEVQSHGIFDQTGGTVDTDILTITGGSLGDAGGLYRLSGTGVVDAGDIEICSFGNASEFVQNDGTGIFGEVTIGDCAGGSRAWMTLEGGSMSASRIDLSDRSPGSLDINGGSLAATRIELGTFAPSGQLTQRGGALDCDQLILSGLFEDAIEQTATFAGGSADLGSVEVRNDYGNAIYITGGHVSVAG